MGRGLIAAGLTGGKARRNSLAPPPTLECPGQNFSTQGRSSISQVQALRGCRRRYT